MIKYLILISIAMLSGTIQAETKDNTPPEFCNRTAIETDTHNLLTQTGLYSDFLVAALSGDIQKALNGMGSELKINIIMLNSIIKGKPCNASEELVSKIYPMLRVVAAVNQKTPIPSIANDKEIQDILQAAINENPKHFQELVNRSKSWEHGIK